MRLSARGPREADASGRTTKREGPGRSWTAPGPGGGEGSTLFRRAGALKGSGQPPITTAPLPSVAARDREQRSQRASRRLKVSRGQSPQLLVSASLETVAPPPLGLGAVIELAPQGLITGGPAGAARPVGSETPPPPSDPRGLDESPCSRVGELRLERKEPPPPPAAATSFVVAFVSRRAHGPGSSTLKVTALMLRRRSLASRPPVCPNAAQRSEMGKREAPLHAGVHTLAFQSLGGVAAEASQSPATCTWPALRRGLPLSDIGSLPH